MKHIEELLIVVDMVNGFMTEGAMADPYITSIIPNVRCYMEEFINDPEKEVMVVNEAHTADSKEFKRYPAHCIEGTREAQLVDGLADLEKKCTVFKKNSTSAAFAPGVIKHILYLVKMSGLKRIKIVGCCTDICIMDLAIALNKFFDEYNIDTEIIIPADAVETYHAEGIHDRDEWNKMAFMFMEQAGIIIEKKEVKVKKR